MKRVLICDDSPVDRKVIAKSLEKHFEVLQADGGDAALEIVKSSAVDLLLLDINMPGKGRTRNSCVSFGTLAFKRPLFY